MMASNNKKEIINEWSEDFSELSIYAQNKLYKVLGPFIIGLEILNLPGKEDYRPIFVCYPLWKSDIKKCLDESVFLQEIYNKKGFQFNVPYTKHSVFFQEAVECTRKQLSILSNEKVSLRQLFEIINRQFSHALIKSSPVGQAKLLEAKLFASIYINDYNSINKVEKEIDKLSKTWSPDLFEWKYGNIEIWLNGLQKMIYNRDEVLKQIENNKQDKKIEKLHNSELTM